MPVQQMQAAIQGQTEECYQDTMATIMTDSWQLVIPVTGRVS